MVPSQTAQVISISTVAVGLLVVALPLAQAQLFEGGPRRACALILPGYICGTDEDIMSCYYWNKDGSRDSAHCTDISLPTTGISNWGWWYCPPPGEHEACDQSGKPTDGTIDIHMIMSNVDTLWDCVQFSQGLLYNECLASCDPDCNSMAGDELESGSLWGQGLYGTYGGFVRD